VSHPRASAGQIKLKHGKRSGDLFFCYGEGTSRSDALLLLAAVKDRVAEPDFATAYRMELEGRMAASVLDQLEARGYDPATLEISIRKKSE
jgi:hypothetical protein